MRRVFLLAAALAIPISGASFVALAGPAGAASAKITCTNISGSASSTVTVSGCTGGVTGGSSQPISGSALALGGTLHWVSGSSTTISAPMLTSTSAKKCPGYVKNGTSNPTADKIAANVTADTGDGLKVPGKVTGAVCISSGGTIERAEAAEGQLTRPGSGSPSGPRHLPAGPRSENWCDRTPP